MGIGPRSVRPFPGARGGTHAYRKFAPPSARAPYAEASENEEDDEYDILCLGMSFKPIPGLFARPDAPKRRIPQQRRYRLLCRDTMDTVSRYCSTTFTIHRCLGCFFNANAVDIILDIMERTSTVISGDAALQFFSRETLDDPVLDLYTEYRHRHTVVRCVVALGFLFQPRMSQPSRIEDALHKLSINRVKDDYVNRIGGVCDVLSFAQASASEARIRIMIVSECAIDAILSQPLTIQLNIITFQAAYSLYPRTAFVDKIVLPLDELEDFVPAKYASRGWSRSTEVTRSLLPSLPAELRAQDRYMGDEYTWTINFDTRPDRPLDPLLFNSWQLSWWETRRQRPALHPTIVRHIYVGPWSWSQNRVLGNEEHVQQFTRELATQQPKDSRQSIVDVIQALVVSGAEYLFHAHLPTPANVRRLRDVNSRQMIVFGAPQLNLDSIDDDVPRMTRRKHELDKEGCEDASAIATK
ncbi:hypothetical protein EV715DRAFT_214686 [Schizophyllum commune]